MDEIMRGEATSGPDRRLPRCAARQGRDGRRDHRVRRGDARARTRRSRPARRPRRRRRHGRRRLRGRSTSRPAAALVAAARRRRRRQARQPRDELVDRLGRRPRGARLRAGAAAGAHRPLDRRARLRLHVRAGPPPGDEARCGGPARARDADRVQRARPADEPGRRSVRRVRRLLAATSCARTPRRSRSSAHGARSSCTARAASTSFRRGTRTWSARSRTESFASGRSIRSTLGIERCDPAELRGGSPEENARIRSARSSSGARGRDARRRSAQRRRRDRRRGARRRPSGGARDRLGRRSTRVLPRDSRR